MKLFLDTANVEDVQNAAKLGVVDGVTTNPSLVAKEGKDGSSGSPQGFKETVVAMCEIVDCVSAQVTATNADEMIQQGTEYASWHKNVVVKVPMTEEGLKAISHFSTNGIKTNTTLVFSVPQAIMAAKAGATIISPFVGRLDDIGQDGMDLIADIMTAWKHYGFKTEVLVASIRNPEHVIRAATLGAHICTIPVKVFSELAKHPLTDKGLEKFLEDWKNVQLAS